MKRILIAKVSLFPLIIPLMLFCSKTHMHQEAPFDGEKVTVDTADLKDEVPVFYTFRDSDKSINFFIIKRGREVFSFFDACSECYAEKRGFRFENGRLSCNVCNVGYPVSKLSEGVGSCYPRPLKGRLKDGLYEIDKKEILEGRDYF